MAFTLTLVGATTLNQGEQTTIRAEVRRNGGLFDDASINLFRLNWSASRGSIISTSGFTATYEADFTGEQDEVVTITCNMRTTFFGGANLTELHGITVAGQPLPPELRPISLAPTEIPTVVPELELVKTQQPLPISASDIERALVHIVQERLQRFRVPNESDRAEIDGRVSPIKLLWDVDECPIGALVFLSNAMSVQRFEGDAGALTEAQHRELIRISYDIHRRKGTIGSIKRLVVALGYAEPTVIENVDSEWWKFSVNLNSPVTINAARVLRQLILDLVPLPYRIDEFTFTSLNSYDGTINYDGSFTYGAINPN